MKRHLGAQLEQRKLKRTLQKFHYETIRAFFSLPDNCRRRKDVAEYLGISENAAGQRFSVIYQILDIDNDASLALWALREGVIGIDGKPGGVRLCEVLGELEEQRLLKLQRESAAA